MGCRLQKVAGSIGEMKSEVVHGILVGILPAQHVLNQRLEKVSKPSRVSVQEKWEGRENNVDSLEISVRRNLLQK